MRSEHADLGARERGAREGASGVKATDAAMSERKTTERIVPSLEQVRGDARFVTDVDHSPGPWWLSLWLCAGEAEGGGRDTMEGPR